MDKIPRKAQVTVIGDAEANPEEYDEALKIGELLAELNVVVITGGRGGVMEAVGKGAISRNAVVVGILPSEEISQANEFCTVVIPTGMGHARNVVTALAGDIIIAIGGGAGTLSELAFSWIQNKPIIAYKAFEGWSKKLAGFSIDSRRRDVVFGVNNIYDLKKALIRNLKKLGFG